MTSLEPEKRQEMIECFKMFGVDLTEVEKRMDKLGEDGMLIVGGTNEKDFVQYYSNKRLHLNRLYFTMASFILKDVKNILEIGTGTAQSTITLSRLFPEATIYTVDLPKNDPNYKKMCQNKPNTERGEWCQQNLNRGKNIVCIQANSLSLPSMNLSQKYELILVDGNHSFRYAFADSLFAYSRLAKGGFLFIHDCNLGDQSNMNDVCRAVNKIDKLISEKLFILPEFPYPVLQSVNMALFVKGRVK